MSDPAACTRLLLGSKLRPLYYHPLSPASSTKREVPETLDLISRLDMPPDMPLDMPDWLAKLVRDKRGASACKVMDEKKISASDISDQLNRFMLPNQDIQDKIKPMMTREEIYEANLTYTRQSGGEEEQPVGRKRGRVHDGLKVMVYNKSGPGCLLYLTRWDSIKSTVLKGPNYKELRRYFALGDLVEMWAFRDGADNLCFVIEKKSA